MECSWFEWRRMFALQEIGSDTAAERAARRRRPAYSALGKLITSRCFPNRRGAARAHASTRHTRVSPPPRQTHTVGVAADNCDCDNCQLSALIVNRGRRRECASILVARSRISVFEKWKYIWTPRKTAVHKRVGSADNPVYSPERVWM